MNEILKKIEAYDLILIHRHKNPDPDALGSQAGLRAILRENFPNKRIYAVGYDEPTLTYLTEVQLPKSLLNLHSVRGFCLTLRRHAYFMRESLETRAAFFIQQPHLTH